MVALTAKNRRCRPRLTKAQRGLMSCPIALDKVRLATLKGEKSHPERREEYHDAATDALIRSAKRYDPSSGVPFHRYAGKRICGSYLKTYRKINQSPNPSPAPSRPLGFVAASTPPEPPGRGEEFPSLIRGLTAEQQAILTKIYVDGLTRVEVARMIGRCKRYVAYQLKAAKETLRASPRVREMAGV